MNGSAALAGAPWDGLVTEFREVIAEMRPRADAELIERACDVAARCHEGQLRLSGDPYITHPVAVATILAGLDDIAELDDQTLCAAVLHDTVEDTPYTMAALRREFGARTAAMVAEVTALDRLGRRPARNPAQVLTTITSADTRVVAVKLADRLHNMQTMQFMPQAKQLRKAREVLDTFLPVAQQLSMHTIRSELQALACAALIRNQPLRPPRRRVIVALDIESSTSRPDPVKAELRTMLYELFDAALRSAGIGARRRGRFTDRGDGLLEQPSDRQVRVRSPGSSGRSSAACARQGGKELADPFVTRCVRTRRSCDALFGVLSLDLVLASGPSGNARSIRVMIGGTEPFQGNKTIGQ